MSNAAEPTRNQVDESVNKFFGFLASEVNLGQKMLDQGVYTSLAQHIKKSFQNPLTLSIDILKSSHEQLTGFMHGIVIDFLKSTTLVHSAFVGNTQKGLMYYVVLKDDTTEHREKFFDFLDEYEYLGIDSHLPIHFQFLPEQAYDHFKEEQKIV